ncbi:MAG TPA: hypothetical protein VF800_02835 [Telluria sp.]|jgi:hypothetical protein
MNEQKKMTIDEAREYLVSFMEANFTDRTYHSYIRGDFGRNALAGDFAWQMATSLRKLATAPHAPAWSAAIAPGPDGYQRTVAVPGMPSAARDAALEEAAAVADSTSKEYLPLRQGGLCRIIGKRIRALKSIAAPVVVGMGGLPAPTELTAELINLLNAIRPNFGDVGTRDIDVAAQRTRIDRAIVQLGLIMAHDGQEHPTPRPTTAPAPVQQAAPSELRAIAAFEATVRNCPVRGLMPDLFLKKLISHDDANPEFLDKMVDHDWQVFRNGWLAAPVQPAGPSEQDKLDAARYRWLRVCGPQFDQFPILDACGNIVADELDKAIDAAILAAKAAP